MLSKTDSAETRRHAGTACPGDDAGYAATDIRLIQIDAEQANTAGYPADAGRGFHAARWFVAARTAEQTDDPPAPQPAAGQIAMHHRTKAGVDATPSSSMTDGSGHSCGTPISG